MAPEYSFDNRNIRWQRLGDLKHFVFYVFGVDSAKGVVDFILKFEPNQRIILHRHLALTNTFVVQGEHRLYEPDGKLKEIRPVGSYTSSPPGEPHSEGGGDQELVVFYSVRGKTGVLFEVLDDDRNIVGTLSTRDFMEAWEEQKKAALVGERFLAKHFECQAYPSGRVRSSRTGRLPRISGKT